jgi:hypothetical protein
MVCGGAGFIGSHLVERLLANGNSVDVVDDLSTGSLAHLRFQDFYKWCSVNYDRVYTVLDEQDLDKHLPYNVWSINESYQIHPRGFLIGTDPYQTNIDILVNEKQGWEWPRIQIHPFGSFEFDVNGVRHFSNSALHRKFDPEKTINLE